MNTFIQIHLNPENKTFTEIMSNGKSYSVPAFQRDYSWKEEQLTELWQDVLHMREDRAQHFMGYLVLQSQDGKAFEIIDGQQRITTINLLVIATLSQLNRLIGQKEDTEKNGSRREHFHKTYLGVFNAVTLGTSPKLTLNRNNAMHFKSIIDYPYTVPKKRGLIETNRRLNKALEFFEAKLKNLEGEELAQFIDDVADGLLFTTITVNDDLDAYTVFETLNARGMYLSAPDLLKNYLLSTLLSGGQDDTERSQEFEDKWSDTLQQLGESDFTDFLRSHEGMHAKLRTKKELYRYLKQERIQTDKTRVMPYVRALNEHAAVYTALKNPDDSFWRENHSSDYEKISEPLRVLRLFSIKTPLSLLMAAYNKLPIGEFITVANWIVAISVRYNVICSKMVKAQESVYNNIAMDLMKDSADMNSLKDKLRTVYPADEEFLSAFSGKSMPSRQSAKKIVYLLGRIERHASGGKEAAGNLTVEHVLPANPDDEWQEYFGRDTYDDAIDRLGNIALLSKSDNRDMDRSPFGKKQELLRNSQLKINRRIAESEDWNIESLNGYQKWLAKQAQAVWHINY